MLDKSFKFVVTIGIALLLILFYTGLPGRYSFWVAQDGVFILDTAKGQVYLSRGKELAAQASEQYKDVVWIPCGGPP